MEDVILVRLTALHPITNTEEGKETLLLRNTENFTNSLRIHIRMMCEVYMSYDLDKGLPENILESINQCEYTEEEVLIGKGNVGSNYIEVICEATDISE